MKIEQPEPPKKKMEKVAEDNLSIKEQRREI